MSAHGRNYVKGVFKYSALISAQYQMELYCTYKFEFSTFAQSLLFFFSKNITWPLFWCIDLGIIKNRLKSQRTIFLMSNPRKHNNPILVSGFFFCCHVRAVLRREFKATPCGFSILKWWFQNDFSLTWQMATLPLTQRPHTNHNPDLKYKKKCAQNANNSLCMCFRFSWDCKSLIRSEPSHSDVVTVILILNLNLTWKIKLCSECKKNSREGFCFCRDTKSLIKSEP